MSIENISISIDPSPLVSIVKTVIREELQPTLYGNDNSLAQLVQEEVEVSPRIHDRIVSIISDYTGKSEFDRTVKDIVGNSIDYSDLAAEIDASDVASHIRLSRLAAEINAYDIANEISNRDIADELSVSDIANEIDIENLADTITEQHMTDIAERVLENIDYKLLARELITALTTQPINTTPPTNA